MKETTIGQTVDQLFFLNFGGKKQKHFYLCQLFDPY